MKTRIILALLLVTLPAAAQFRENAVDGPVIGSITPAGTDYMVLNRAGVNGQALLSSLSGLYQPASANLTTYSGIAPSANVQTLLGAANYSAFRTSLGVVIGTDVQAYDADLTSWAAIAPSAKQDALTFTGTGDTVRSNAPTIHNPTFTGTATIESLAVASFYPTNLYTGLTNKLLATDANGKLASVTNFSGVTFDAATGTMAVTASYGVIRADGGVGTAFATTFRAVTNYTASYLSGFTANTSSGYLTNTSAGTYEIAASFGNVNAGGDFTYIVETNGVSIGQTNYTIGGATRGGTGLFYATLPANTATRLVVLVSGGGGTLFNYTLRSAKVP